MPQPSDYYTPWEVEVVQRAYVECAMWSSTVALDEEGGNEVSADRYTLHPDDRAILDEQVVRWLRYLDSRGVDYHNIDPESMGHDLWLTRNDHGSGFWDRGYPKEVSDGLMTALREGGFREVALYLYTDGYIHVEC